MRFRSEVLRSTSGAALMLLVGCGGEGLPERSTEPPPAAASLAADPDFLSAGGVFEGDSVPFFGVADGAFTADGNAVIGLGRGQNTLIVLDGRGQIVNVLGGAGDGPRELRSIPQLHRVDGRLVVLDQARRRYLPIGDSALGDAVSYERGPQEREVGLLDDGAMFTTRRRSAARPEADPQTSVVTRYHLRVGAVADTFDGPASPPEPSFIVGTMSNGATIGIASSGCLPENLYASDGSVLLIADARAGLVMSLSRTGTFDALYQSSDRGVVTQPMLDGAQDRLTNTIENAALLPGAAEGVEFHTEAFWEAVGKLGDPLPSEWNDALWDGRLLWLRRTGPCFLGAGNVEPSRWDAIDVESRSRVAVLEVPAAVRLLAITSDRVLGVTRDQLDVEQVGVYRIVR